MAPTFEGFLAFAKEQTGTFDYCENSNCAFAQYLKSLGGTCVSVNPSMYRCYFGDDVAFGRLDDLAEGLSCAILDSTGDYRMGVDTPWAVLVDELEKLQ